MAIGERLILPALTAVGGWVSSLARYSSRLSSVEDDVKSLEGTKGDHESRLHVLETKHASVEDDIRVHRQMSEQDHAELQAFVDKKIDELHARMSEFEENFNRFKDNSSSFAKDDVLMRFIEEQQRQWQQIQRTLGQIEGVIKNPLMSRSP